MFPPLWGYLFWALLHAIAKAFAVHHPEAIPSELSEALFQFMVKLCRYLPCPGCRVHCMAYTQQRPPRFTCGLDVWTYFVDFHNAVNARTHKTTMTYDEAEAVLVTQLAEFGWTVDHLEQAFCQDWWTALLMTTFSMSLTPDTPKEEEKKDFQAFLHHAVMILPFSFKPVVRDLLVTMVDSPSFNLSTRDMAFEALTQLHNAVCADFGRVPKTVKEMKELFNQHFEQRNTTELIRANQIHEEDQKKLVALQTELDTLRLADSSEGPMAAAAGSGQDVSHTYQTATVALSCLLGVILCVLVLGWLVYRFKWAHEWRWVRVSKKSTRMAHQDDPLVT